MKVGLFVTCPVDLFRPSVAEATIMLLEKAGCTVEVPAQSCCGQVAFNNGEPVQTRQLAWQVVTAFEEFEYTVIPSGSCGGMIKLHYPELFAGDERLPRVNNFCDKVFELTTFLNDVMHFQETIELPELAGKTITYHDSCAGLRELDIQAQPRALLKRCNNLAIKEMPDSNVCCGFGGTFCVKFPEVSNAMVGDKLQNAQAVNADVLLGGDVSCLLNIAGKATRDNSNIEVRHVAEVLAGHLASSAIGKPED